MNPVTMKMIVHRENVICEGTRYARVEILQNAEPHDFIASMIINGRGYMPAMGEVLDDDQIAAIATFARNSWANAYGPVTPQDVRDMR